MYRIAVVLLLLSSLLWAETQEEAYFRAMKAEEAGDVSSAVKAFEDAVALPGPYTAELQEILKSYYEALGVRDDGSVVALSYRFLGDAGFYGLRYDEFGAANDMDEYGGDLYLSLTPFLDYSTGSWIHSFGLGLTGDWFLMNDNMPALDTNDWTLSIGAEYSLVGQNLMLDIGADLNLAEGEDPSGTFFGWLHRDFYRMGKNRFGASSWAYYDTEGPMFYALFASWNRTSAYGFSGSAYLGLRFEADYVSDLKKFLADYKKALNDSTKDICYTSDTRDECWTTNSMGALPVTVAYCMEKYGMDCPYMDENAVDSIYWEDRLKELDSTIVIPFSRYYGKWLGPTLRSRVAYKFRNSITVEAKLNLFYGFVIDGPDEDYEKIQKFVGNWGLMAYWKPNFASFYLGLEQVCKSYNLSDYYKKIYSKGNLLTELKVGVKWEL